MKVVLYSMMIKNIDGSTFAIIDKKIDECVTIINNHVKDEYKIDIKLTYTKLYDILRGKTKKTFFNSIIELITSKQLNREELEAQRAEARKNIIVHNGIEYDLDNQEDFANYGLMMGYL